MAVVRDERPIVYVEGMMPVYRASAIGGCIRAIVASRMGFDPMESPDFMVNAAEEGTRLEPVVLDALFDKIGASGITYIPQVEVEDRTLPNCIIRGHLDAIITEGEIDPSVCGPTFPSSLSKFGGVIGTNDLINLHYGLIEIKTMSDAVFKKFIKHGLKAFPRYMAQISFYHHAVMHGWTSDNSIGLSRPDYCTIIYACYNRDTGALAVTAFPTNESPLSYIDVAQRVLTAEYNARQETLPDCEHQGDYMAHQTCAYRYLCNMPSGEGALNLGDPGVADDGSGDGQADGQASGRQTQVDEIRRARIKAWAKKYAEAVQIEKSGASLKDEAKHELMEALGEDKTETVDGYKVTVVDGQRTTYDHDRMAIDLGAETLAKYAKVTTYKGIRVTEVASK